MAFDRAAAKAAGYSDEEINAYLQANPEAAKDTPPAPTDSDAPPAPSTKVPEVDRTASTLGTAGLGIGEAASLAKELASPAATAYGAYKVGKIANAVANKLNGPAIPTSSTIGTPGNPIGGAGPVAPQAVPIAQAAQTAAPAEQSLMSRAGQLASRYAPAMRAGLGAAARVAGPVGLAMGAYDAAQMARESELGNRLARGEGQRATQAFSGLMNQNVSGYTPTPQEARNLLDSGDERTINIYGGRLKLEGLASPGPNAIKSGYTQELKRLGR